MIKVLMLTFAMGYLPGDLPKPISDKDCALVAKVGDTCTADDGSYMMWDDGWHKLEVEISEDIFNVSPLK